jgi:predicted amidohydrolase YtcJ
VNADLILTGARVLTADPLRPRAEAVAIRAGRILAVGRAADMDALTGPETRVVNLAGHTVLPGFIDSHTHGLWGAARDLLEVFTGLGSTHAELLDAIAARVGQVAPGRWLVAGPWSAHKRAELGARPADLLDRLAPDVPVLVKDVTQHSLWVNSAAMRAAGLTADTPDPEGGEIERDASGAPTGILRENAISLVVQGLVHPPSEAARALRHMVSRFHGWGLTGFKEPMGFETDLETYAEGADTGALTLHTGVHLARQSPFGAMTPMETLADWRRRFARPTLHTGFAKLFLDGVAPSHTAAFHDPYLGTDPATHDPEAMLLLSPDSVAAEVTALDAAGFTVKMHAVGDRAVQAGLDAIAAARLANGASGLRHEIAHCPFIRPVDLPRFAALGAVAEVSPKLWFPGPVTEGQRAVLGMERTEACHPIGDLLRAGAEVVYGSDWPAAAADANPWTGLAGMISRRDPGGRYPGTLGARQAISLDQALALFTSNGARALGLEGQTGCLRAGLGADLVVIRGDMDRLTPEEIGATVPVAVLWQGRQVFGAV